MLKEFKFTESGMGITEGTVAKWHKAEGDHVAEGEVLVDMETAKAVTELSSPVAGRLERILFAEGATVEVEATLALLQPDGAT